MKTPTIIVYGADWCRDCIRVREFFNKHSISYQWVDIDEDKNAEQLVIEINRGNRSIPTIFFADGSILVEPSNFELAEKLAIRI